jgi:hypothetical protein
MEVNEMLVIQSRFEDLLAKIEALAESKIIHPEPSRSSDIKDLAIALAKAQSEMPVAGLNKVNPYFKSNYSDFQSIVSASRPALSKNGLSVIQQIIYSDDGQSSLITTLLHASGQWITSKARITPVKNDIQSVSSYVTYLKRLCYAALIGVVTGDEDDDGEVAVATTRETFAKGTSLNTKYNPKEETIETITPDQRAEMEYELAEYPDIAEMVLDTLKLQSIADLPKSKYRASIERIRAIKQARNGIK